MFYNEDRKIYLPCTRKRVLLADAIAKSKMFLERYSQVLQKTRRAFAQTQLRGPEHELTLQTVDYLLTLSEVTLERTLILGSLLQVTDGKYVLEDPTGTVHLDLSHAKYLLFCFIYRVFHNKVVILIEHHKIALVCLVHNNHT